MLTKSLVTAVSLSVIALTITQSVYRDVRRSADNIRTDIGTVIFTLRGR
jgi:hypothetical protein